jgi:hypothetical protein
MARDGQFSRMLEQDSGWDAELKLSDGAAIGFNISVAESIGLKPAGREWARGPYRGRYKYEIPFIDKDSVEKFHRPTPYGRALPPRTQSYAPIMCQFKPHP